MKKSEWEKITQFSSPEQSPGFLLWQVSTQWRRQISEVLAPLDLTHPQFVLLATLSWLTDHDKPVSQVQLARYCAMDAATTSQILRSLEKKGWIKRESGAHDERAKRPVVTPAGCALIEKAMPLVEEADEAFFAPLGKRISSFTKDLNTLCSPS